MTRPTQITYTKCMTETTFKSKKLEEGITTRKKKLSDTRIITVRVEPELYQELKRRAEKQNLSLNNYIKMALSELVKTPRGRATGHLKAKNQKLTDYCYGTQYIFL